MVTLQVDVPLHPPVHPVNVELDAGAAVSVTAAPVEKLDTHVVPQLMPAGLLVMLPEPEPELVTAS
jgi:hypothetical protein